MAINFGDKSVDNIQFGNTPIKSVYYGSTKIRPEKPTFTGLTFTAEEANSTVQLNRNGTPPLVNLETSTDGTTWTDYTIGNSITLANIGDKVYMRNKSETDTGFSIDSVNYYRFVMTGKIGASGDVTSLLNKNGTDTVGVWGLATLFQDCASLTTPPELPATTLDKFCYRYLFRRCTSLIVPPELPATTLSNSCYNSMFQGCTSLTTVPELPATELANYCYQNMFQGCISLTTVPTLSATTLSDYCYNGMFYNCTGLTTPPELLATTLANNCYGYMFYGCTSIKLSETETSEYNIPYRIPTTGTGTAPSGALNNMFSETGGTFKGTPSINTTYYLSNGQGPTLLSYEEIKAMSITDAINELNSHPTEYYDKFSSEGHISTKYTDSGLANSSNTGYQTWVNSLGNTVSAMWNIYSDSRWTEEVGYN